MQDLPKKVDGITMKWEVAIGFQCLVVATILKLFDMTLHFLLPTPAPRAQKPPKDVTELVEFMMLGTKQNSATLEQAPKQEVMPKNEVKPETVGGNTEQAPKKEVMPKNEVPPETVGGNTE